MRFRGRIFKEGSCSFLKKRTKKLLVLWVLATVLPASAGQSFFASFCSQKEVFPFYVAKQP
jgi:hypothetical protein